MSQYISYLRLALPIISACAVIYGCGGEAQKKSARTGGTYGAGVADASSDDNNGDARDNRGNGGRDGADDAQDTTDGGGGDGTGGTPGTDGGGDGGTPVGNDGGGDAGTPEPEVSLQSTVGVKNFRQLSATMAALTGVPETTPAIVLQYANLQTQLPDANDIRAFLGSHQVAMAKLAVEYCNVMVDTPATATALFPGVDLTQVPATALTPANREKIIDALTAKFWGTGMADLPDMTATKDALEALFDGLVSGAGATATNVSKGVVKGVCSAVLASGPVTFQ